MAAIFGARQMKLAATWLAGAAKLAGYSGVGGAIGFALQSLETADALRPGNNDAVTQALLRVRADVEAGTKAALSAEFGADWETRVDLSATIEALPLVLDRYALDTDAIFAANLDPERIAARMAQAADDAHEDLFRGGTLGETMLRRVVTEAYAAARTNKDYALSLLLRGQQEILDRQDDVRAISTQGFAEIKDRLDALSSLIVGNLSAEAWTQLRPPQSAGARRAEPATYAAPPPGAATKRFVGRNEYFGSLVFDRERGDYIPFDDAATEIFRAAVTHPAAEIYDRLSGSVARESFETFVQLCKAIELFDDAGLFAGVFLGNAPSQGYLSAPARVHLAVTKACNFRCRHCFSASGNPYPDELTTAEIKRFIDELADLGCYMLSFGGGEPLVRHDLLDLIRHANSRGIVVGLSTNAVAATRDMVEALKDFSLYGIKVSMDGATDALYDAIRDKSGAFQQALQGITNLRALKVPITLHRVLMRPNAAELPELIRLAETLGVSQVSLSTLMPVGRAATSPDLQLGWADLNRLSEQADAAIGTSSVTVKIPQRVPPNGGAKKLFAGFGCNCGHALCYVDPRGEVSPTGFLKDTLSAGNVRRQSFKEIWDSGVGLVRMRHLPGNEQCTSCTHFSVCRGGCRASALLVHQDIDLPDANCALAHAGRV